MSRADEFLKDFGDGKEPIEVLVVQLFFLAKHLEEENKRLREENERWVPSARMSSGSTVYLSGGGGKTAPVADGGSSAWGSGEVLTIEFPEEGKGE